MTAAAHEPADARFLAATDALLRARREQRGAPRFGDAADERLLDALALLRDAHAPLAREGGHLLGREVFARRIFEDSLPACLVALSLSVAKAGWGEFALEDHFHRTATVRFVPRGALAAMPHVPLDAFLAGLLEGSFGEALNCAAHAVAKADLRFELALREGRDVNRGGAA